MKCNQRIRNCFICKKIGQVIEETDHIEIGSTPPFPLLVSWNQTCNCCKRQIWVHNQNQLIENQEYTECLDKLNQLIEESNSKKVCFVCNRRYDFTNFQLFMLSIFVLLVAKFFSVLTFFVVFVIICCVAFYLFAYVRMKDTYKDL